MVSAKIKKKKQQPQNKPKIKEQGSHDWLHQIAFWGLVLLLFFPPYFRGLFFAPEQEKALILAALVFWVTFFWRWLQRDHKFLATPLDWFALALPVVYILSTFVAVNKGLAIQEVVKNILYFLTFWSVSRLVRHEKDAENILKVIYISAVGVALAGLATATGIIDIKDGFLNGRIYSTFQYPNALASLLGGAIFLGVYFWNRVRDRYSEDLEITANNLLARMDKMNFTGYLYAAGNYFILVVLIGTKSHGGILVFSLATLIYLIGAGAEKRYTSALHLGCLGLIAIIAANKFIPLASGDQPGQAWLWIAAGLLIAITIQWIFYLIDRKIFTAWARDTHRYNRVFAAFALICILTVVLVLLPGMNRIAEVNNLIDAFHRIHYIGSAWEMTLERPLLGWGGGGWQEAYQSFMDYNYTTRQVHSYYFQVGVETGFFGLLIISGIWVSFLYLAHRLYWFDENRNSKQLVWALTVIFFMIAGHALIDFDLSLSALTNVLWSIFGIAVGLYRKYFETGIREVKKHSPQKPLLITMATVVVVLNIIGSFILVQARTNMSRGMSLIRSQQVSGLHYMEKAVSHNPFNAGYWITLSKVHGSMGEHAEALIEAQRAVKLSSYDPDPRDNLVQISLAAGEHDIAAEALKNAIELAPNRLAGYENAIRVYAILGRLELKKGNSEKAREYFRNCMQVPEKMRRYWTSISEDDKEMWRGAELEITRQMQLYMGQSSYWLGDYKTAEGHLQQAAKSKNLSGEALIYLALVKDKQGKIENAQQFLIRARESSQEVAMTYNKLSSLRTLTE